MNVQIFKYNNIDVVSSRTVAKELEKQHKHVIRDIDTKIKERPNLDYAKYFVESYYQVNDRNYREYLITKDGFILLVFNYNGHDDFKMAYIERFNYMENLLMNLYTGGISSIEAHKELLVLETNELKKEIEHKEDVIIGLVDNIPLVEKRQVLNRVVRMGDNVQARWAELYTQFEQKYHLDLNARLERYNRENKPKLKNKLDYIDKEMDQVNDLYEIACLLYESDIQKLTNRMYKLNSEN